jgi:hypothetical protein
MVEHARQQRLDVKCRNCNNGMDPLIGTIVVASTHEVDDDVYWHVYQTRQETMTLRAKR